MKLNNNFSQYTQALLLAILLTLSTAALAENKHRNYDGPKYSDRGERQYTQRNHHKDEYKHGHGHNKEQRGERKHKNKHAKHNRRNEHRNHHQHSPRHSQHKHQSHQHTRSHQHTNRHRHEKKHHHNHGIRVVLPFGQHGKIILDSSRMLFAGH